MFMIKPAVGTRFVELEQAEDQVVVRVDGKVVVVFQDDAVGVYEGNVKERGLTVEKR